jgi:long-subunit fatty acid transport protein
MRLRPLTGSLIVLLLLTLPVTSLAGTYFIGVRGWDATWDSGILDWLEKDVTITFRDLGHSFTANRDSGTGYLAGPQFGYQMDGGKWSIGFSPMIVSSFTQDWEGALDGVPLTGDVELKREDYDLAVNYAINDNYKIYFGLKYQVMGMDFTLNYLDPGTGTPQADTYQVDSTALIPTGGVGTAWPLMEKMAFSGQLGLLYSFTEFKVKDDLGQTYNIWPRPGFGVNAEMNLTFKPVQELLLQLGYRYQAFSVSARGPGRIEITEAHDVTYGFTLAAVYLL